MDSGSLCSSGAPGRGARSPRALSTPPKSCLLVSGTAGLSGWQDRAHPDGEPESHWGGRDQTPKGSRGAGDTCVIGTLPRRLILRGPSPPTPQLARDLLLSQLGLGPGHPHCPLVNHRRESLCTSEPHSASITPDCHPTQVNRPGCTPHGGQLSTASQRPAVPTPGPLCPRAAARATSAPPLEWGGSGSQSGHPAHGVGRPSVASVPLRARPGQSGRRGSARHLGHPACWERDPPGRPAAGSGPARPDPVLQRPRLRGAPAPAAGARPVLRPGKDGKAQAAAAGPFRSLRGGAPELLRTCVQLPTAPVSVDFRRHTALIGSRAESREEPG